MLENLAALRKGPICFSEANTQESLPIISCAADEKGMQALLRCAAPLAYPSPCIYVQKKQWAKYPSYADEVNSWPKNQECLKNGVARAKVRLTTLIIRSKTAATQRAPKKSFVPWNCTQDERGQYQNTKTVAPQFWPPAFLCQEIGTTETNNGGLVPKLNCCDKGQILKSISGEQNRHFI